VLGGSNPGVGVGVTLLVLIIVTAALGAIWIFRKKQFGPKPISAIAFENPSYIREPNPDASVNVIQFSYYSAYLPLACIPAFSAQLNGFLSFSNREPGMGF